MKIKLLIVLLFVNFSSQISNAQNVFDVWDQPSTTLNNTFTVQARKMGDANWTNLSVYNVIVGHQDLTNFNSSMVNFDFIGTVEIKVTYNKAAINSFDLRPSSYGINASQNDNSLTFTVSQDIVSPRKIVLRINNSWDTEALHILTNVPEIDVPSEIAANVYVINGGDPIPFKLPAGKDTYYFKQGIHILPKGLWVELDLGTNYSINKFDLFQGTYNGMVDQTKFVVETKLNESDAYTIVYDGTANTTIGTISQAFSPTNARYVRLRLLGTNSTGSYVFSSLIKEFKVYENGGITNLALYKSIAGSMIGYQNAVDGNVASAYMSSTGYGNWHAGESFFISQSNINLYIAKGATLKGSIMSDGMSNINIYGRGRLDCTDLRHDLTTPASEGRTGAIWIVDGADNKVEGITILDPPMWSIVMNKSTRPIVKGVNLIARSLNSDGIHFSGSNYGIVDNIFIRTPDDNLVMYHYWQGSYNTFKNSVLFNNDAHCILIGLAGSNGNQPINNLRFENIDIVDQQGVYDLSKFNGCFKLWPNGGNTVSKVIFDNIRIDNFSIPANSSVLQFRTDERFAGEGTGSISDVTVSNITYNGSGERTALLQGVDAAHEVSNINFVNYMRQGNAVYNSSSGNFNIQPFVDNVQYSFDASKPLTSNLALNKTATSDQTMVAGKTANLTVDGNISTSSQSSTRTTPWKLTIDLGSSLTFNRLVLKFGNTDYASVYTVQGSNDNTNWINLISETGSAGGIKVYSSFGNQTFRYVRLNPSTCVLTAGTNGYSILEFEVYKDASSLNLSLNKVTSSDQTMYSTTGAEKTTDGNSNTYSQASSRTTPWKLTVDFNSIKTFNRMVLSFGASEYPSVYTIQGSNDATNWTTIVSENGSAGGIKSYNNFGNLSYRYIRLNPTICVLSAGTWGYSIFEFEVFNDTPASYDLALYKSTLSDQVMYTGYGADNITDDSFSTYAQASLRTTPWKFTIDLGSSLAFNRLVLTSGASEYASVYNIEGSDDMFNWTVLANEINGSGSTKTYNNFGNVSFRYIRLNPTACVLSTGTWGYSVFKFEVYNDGGNTSWSRRNDNATAGQYYKCQKVNSTNYYLSDAHSSNIIGSYAEFNFTGTGIRWIGEKGINHGKADVYIDGAFDSAVDTYNSTILQQIICFEKTGLSYGAHTIRIVVRADKNASALDNICLWDAFDYYPSTINSPQQIVNEVKVNKAEAHEIKVYPNPTMDQLIIQISDFEKSSKFAIYNIQGTMLQNGILNSASTYLNLINMPVGLYLLRITMHNNQQLVKKIEKVQ